MLHRTDTPTLVSTREQRDTIPSIAECTCGTIGPAQPVGPPRPCELHPFAHDEVETFRTALREIEILSDIQGLASYTEAFELLDQIRDKARSVLR